MRAVVSLITLFSITYFFCISEVRAQSSEEVSTPQYRLEFGGFIGYVTSARVYPAPRDQDPTLKIAYNGFGGFLSFGGDVRLELSSTSAIGILFQPLASSESIGTIYGYNVNGDYVGVPVRDGFSLWVVEADGYFSIPIVQDQWNIYLGGGPELYFGKRNMSIGDADATTPLVVSGGIQVAMGISYMLSQNWGLRWEFKFRSPEFNTTSNFQSAYTEYNGLRVSLPGTQYGKVNVDGTNFTLGAFYEF
ncbi:MAG: hypothetical protein M1339_03935 [Bacteroidetes bacterium]|nr:hypothetical protein [Bacteroidota bacterium]